MVDGRDIKPHDEDNWKKIIISATISRFNNNDDNPIQLEFLVTGPCARCTVINVNPENGTKSPQTLKTLSTYRKDEKNNILFGQYLAYETRLQQILNQGNDLKNNECIFISSESSICHIIE